MAFIIKQKTANGRYSVHLATSVHRPGKTPCHTRQHLGTLDPLTGKLLLARDLPEPSDLVRGLLAKKGISYLGRRGQGPGRGPRANPTPSPQPAPTLAPASVRLEEVGRPGVLQVLADEAGLPRALREAFGVATGQSLLWAAMHLLCENDPLAQLDDWATEVSGLPTPLLAHGKILDCLRAVGGNGSGRQRFFQLWLAACGMPPALAHDTSSITTYAAMLEEAEWGYQRALPPGPQFSLSVVVARGSRLPLWYRTQGVTLPDLATLGATAKRLTDLGLDDLAFTLDRGCFSQANLLAMLRQGRRFIIGLPMHLEQAEDLLQAHWQTLSAFKHAFLFQGSMIGHVPCVYELALPEGGCQRLAAHLYYDPERREQLAARLGRTVLGLQERASTLTFASQAAARQWLAENTGNYEKYFTVLKHEGQIRIHLVANRVEASSRKFGVWLIVTSEAADSPTKTKREQVLTEYRGRELTERLLTLYRASIGPEPPKTIDGPLAEGRLLLAFLALTWRTLLENRLRQATLPRPLTPGQALAILKKVKRLHPPVAPPVLLELPRQARELLRGLSLNAADLGVPEIP